MMMLAFVWLLARELPSLSAQVVGRIECGRVAAIHHGSDAVYVIDEDGVILRLVLDGRERHRWGRTGQGPGEIELPITCLWTTGDQLVVSDRAGKSTHRYQSKDGSLIDSKRYGQPLFYRSDRLIDLVLTPQDFSQSYAPVEVVLFREGKELERIPLSGEGSRALLFQTGVVVLGNHVLVGTQTSIEGIVDLVVLDMTTGTVVRKSQVPLLDRRGSDANDLIAERAGSNPTLTIPVVQGWTASLELKGWVMTEHTAVTDYRVIRIIRLNEKDDIAFRLDYPKNESSWSFVQHMKERRWLAYNGSELVVFDVEPPYEL